MKKVFVLSLGMLLLSISVNAEEVLVKVIRDDDAKKDSKYDYVYMNPPRTSLQTNGRYILSTSGVRYVHSPSKHKRASAAARINAYNYEYGNY